MITRDAETVLRNMASQFKAIALTGPRQSGKSTLARTTFPDKKYISLENPDIRQAALDDTRGFLNNLPAGAIIDEAQRVPELFSDDIRVHGISIDNDMSIPNSDGVDLYDSKNAVISDCVINSGDDAIALISSDNITVGNCVLHSRSSGIRIGYNVFNHHNSGNLLFDNIRIYDSNRGIGIFQRMDGDMTNMIFSNVIIQTRLHTGEWWGHGEPIHVSAIPGLGSKTVGKIGNIRFSHVVARAQTGIVLYGSADSRLKDITLEDIDLTIERGPLTDSYGGNIDLRPSNDLSLAIFRHDIPAVFAHGVDGLDIRHFRVHWGSNLPTWFQQEAAFPGCTGVRVEDWRNSQAR